MRTATALLAVATMATAALGQATSSKYTDPFTGFHFQSYAASSGYRFSLVLPDSPFATTDLIAQLVSPLNSDGDGWAGIDFGSKMVGPLLLVAWPTRDTANPVIVSPRQAHGKSPDSVHVYTDKPVRVKQIPKGTFVNGTHITATFLCEGCVNTDSFDPKSSQIWQFAFAYSSKRVAIPGSPDTALSDHQGRSGLFGVDLEGARSSDFQTYAKMASGSNDGPTTTTGGGSGGTTGTGTPGNVPLTTKPSGARRRGVGMGALGAVGVVWAVMALLL